MLAPLLSSWLLPLTLAAPAKRATPLNCVRYQSTPPFQGYGGVTDLYANITQFHPDTQSTTFNETQVGINGNGELQPCGDCRSTQQFAFEICQSPDGKGFDGLANGAEFFYGHLQFTYDQASWQCLRATKYPGLYNGSSISLADCEYDYDNAGASGQYWKISNEDNIPKARLVTQNTGESWGVNPDVEQDEPTTLWDGVPTGPFTFLGFKAFGA